MKYALVAVPAAPLRRAPSHRKEMVSQLIFGEAVRLLKWKGKEWVKVRGRHDGYEGWMTATMLEECDEHTAESRCIYTSTDLLNCLILEDQQLNIPAACTLPLFSGREGRLGKRMYIFSGGYRNRTQDLPSSDLLHQFALPWLNVPYLWGGRTPLGVDCSGFVQVIFKQLGFDLPRDAWQQARAGRPVKKFADAQPGDLVFFNNKEEIVHTGILLNREQLIHASGKVRIDAIDKKGIISLETGKRTLRLTAVRRLW